MASDITPDLVPNEPDLTELLRLFKKEVLLDFNCHHIGRIESFNAGEQTAKVSISYTRTIFKPNTAGVTKAASRAFPVLVDAPVMFPNGGGFALTFPVKKGDSCLVLFNDRDIDAWFAGNENAQLNTPRLHSFTDGIVLVGPRSLPKAIKDFSTDCVELRNADRSVRLSVYDGKIEIFGPGDAKTVIDGSGYKIEVSSDVSLSLTPAGKFAVKNSTGELIAALIQYLQTATAGGFPLVGNLTTLESFKE